MEVVYDRRSPITSWTVDADAKVHEVYGEKKQGFGFGFGIGIWFCRQPIKKSTLSRLAGASV